MNRTAIILQLIQSMEYNQCNGRFISTHVLLRLVLDGGVHVVIYFGLFMGGLWVL